MLVGEKVARSLRVFLVFQAQAEKWQRVTRQRAVGCRIQSGMRKRGLKWGKTDFLGQR